MDFYSSIDSSQLDTQKPTIFEVVSCSQLDSLLTPSLRFLLTHYTHRYPRLLLKILNNFDEINALLRGIIELTYLKTWNATFIEKFYGIKRVSSIPILPNSPSILATNSKKYDELKKLTTLQIIISLIDAVGIPYVASKTERFHERLIPQYLLNTISVNIPPNGQDIEEEKENRKNQQFSLKLISIWCKLKRILKDSFFKYYPTVKLVLKLITLLLNILYLSNKTSSISIIQLLSKISYSRITQLDHMRVEEQLSSPKSRISTSVNVPPTLSSTLFSNIQSLSQPLCKMAWATTDTILPVSIFLLKFLEWYNSNRNSQNKKDDDSNNFVTPIVPSIVPIDALTSTEINDSISTHDSLCRICHQEMHNPAIIETGYVFCYKCIYEYLRDQPKEQGGRCPVTDRRLLGCSWGDSRNEWIVRGLRRVII